MLISCSYKDSYWTKKNIRTSSLSFLTSLFCLSLETFTLSHTTFYKCCLIIIYKSLLLFFYPVNFCKITSESASSQKNLINFCSRNFLETRGQIFETSQKNLWKTSFPKKICGFLKLLRKTPLEEFEKIFQRRF